MLMLVLAIILCIFEAVKVDDFFTTKFSARSNLMTCVIVEMFSFSFLGEQIKHESRKISDQIYNSNWYNLNIVNKNSNIFIKFKPLMLLTVMRAERNVKISVGGISTMGYETFLSVRKKLR
jgi:hypothetical protein